MSGTLLTNTPQCFVDIWPYEGGSFTLTGDSAGILSLQMTKMLGQVGTFNMQLVASGPNGPNARPSWLDIITPMSLCVIGMQRAGYQQIVMIGVVLDITESTNWSSQGVRRTLLIQGADFQYFFENRNFYALTYLQSTAGAIVGALGLPGILGDGLLHGTPDQLGKAWFTTVMAGQKGILSNTQFNYDFSNVKFNDIMATYFEPYPAVGNIGVPVADWFMVGEETWGNKFRKIFPFPWYEFFVITAPTGEYPADGAPTPIFMNQIAVPSSPTLVARINPLPNVKVTSPGSTQFQLDYSNWNALTPYTIDVGGFISSSIRFGEEEVRNFYIINPIWTPFTYGINNAQLAPFIYDAAAWADINSINRYGYRPQIDEIHWMYDPEGQNAQQIVKNGNANDWQTLIENLSLRQVSFYEPTPVMAKGTVTINLRPDIIPGNTFTYSPFKDFDPWQVYIEGISHVFTFGGSCATTIQFSRGLPATVYSNNDGLLGTMTGTVVRQNGVYTKMQNAKPIQPLNQTTMQGVLGQMAQIFVSPQQM